MYISTRRLYWEYYIFMNACMYVCIMYLCMFVLQSARRIIANRRADRRVVCCRCTNKYVRIENVHVCIIYRRADYTGSTIYV